MRWGIGVIRWFGVTRVVRVIRVRRAIRVFTLITVEEDEGKGRSGGVAASGKSASVPEHT